MSGQTLFFGVLLTVAQATVVVDGADSTNWLQIVEPVEPVQTGASTFSWIPRTAPLPHAVVDGDVTGFVGLRAIEGDAWRNLPPVFQAGVEVTLGTRSWWVRPVIGYYHANGSGNYHGPGEFDLKFGTLGAVRESEARGQMTVAIDELDLGLRRDWNWRWLRLGGATGAGWVRARLEDRPAATIFRQFAQVDLSPRTDQAQSIAWWSSVGLSAELGETHIGLAARYTYAPVQVFERTLQAGGMQVGGTIAWAW